MLTKILSRDSCARCRICCAFDSDDIWEAPLISPALQTDIQNKFPQQEFVLDKNSAILKMEKAPDGLFYCPMLSEKGCVLGDSKPFDCRIWPFRVMKLNDMQVITLSPVCGSLFSKPLSELCAFVQEEFSDEVFQEADKFPDMVKEYIPHYPILAVKL